MATTRSFAKQLGDVRKVVVSRQSLEFPWRNSELIEGDLLDAVASLKADAGIEGILIPGSISVVQQLLAAGLVDELRLLVHPVAARKGRKLFDDGDAPVPPAADGVGGVSDGSAPRDLRAGRGPDHGRLRRGQGPGAGRKLVRVPHPDPPFN